MSFRTILEMTASEARSFLLKQSSYCSVDLPPYFTFEPILQEVSIYLETHELNGVSHRPHEHENVNYLLMSNKDGKHAWRPFEIMHPALYVDIVHKITDDESWTTIQERFEHFHSCEHITCVSMPVESTDETQDREEQILNWWSENEQRSLELALDYEVIVHADITDCYSQLYTHSIAWAVHTREVAKANRRNRNLIGNVIDSFVQNMREGQTNGIPQGSVLMDFIAEMVLGYMDELLETKISTLPIDDYKIIRYRDDYRIFVHNEIDGHMILKALTEVLIEFGFKLNSSKTIISDDIVTSSIKRDKLEWLFRKREATTVQKQLLIIHDHARKYPNAGSLLRALSEIRSMIYGLERLDDVRVVISIVVDIAYKNPRTYPVCSAILSKLFQFLESDDIKQEIIEKIVKKFSKLPNTGYMHVWLQRISLPMQIAVEYEEKLCEIANGSDTGSIWNSVWITGRDLKQIVERSIINDEKLDSLSDIIEPEEYELFLEDFY